MTLRRGTTGTFVGAAKIWIKWITMDHETRVTG
jgi:uncharacterized RmlC-like cupin family protein